MRKKWLWILGGLVILGALATAGRGDYRAFDAQREAWHRRCDVYVGKAVRPQDREAAEACKRELDALMAYAKQKGW